MTGKWKVDRFPKFEKPLHDLVNQHLKLDAEPLHLAVAYGPNRDKDDVFLLEVVGGISGNSLSPDNDLFETVIDPGFGLVTGFDRPLHMILTNQREFDLARSNSWPLADEVLASIRNSDFQVLHEDAIGRQILNSILPGTNGNGVSSCG